MAALHFRHASVNTAFEPRPQSDEGKLTVARARTPVGHRRGRSLGSTEKADPDAEPLLSESKEVLTTNTKPRSNATLAVLWVCSIILTALFTYLVSNRERSISPLGSFANGFETELRAARSTIHLQRQQFYGSPDFKDRHEFIPLGSPSLKYIGANPEVDAAWEELTKDRYFLLSDDETREAYGDDPSKYWNVAHGGYVAGLDVLHTLHCLNHLRKSLYPEYYPQDPQHSQMHQAHCVDHLRQLAMCNADLTPVPTQYFIGLGSNYINSSREHTCRDFSRVRVWATERFNGSTAVKPRNRDGTPRKNFYAPWSVPVVISPEAETGGPNVATRAPR